MKKRFIYLALAFNLTLAACNSQDISSLREEHQLDLELYFKNSEEAEVYMGLYEQFTFNNQRKPSFIGTIKMSAFFKLYHELMSRDSIDPQDITGIMLTPGIVNSNELEVYYNGAYVDVTKPRLQHSDLPIGQLTNIQNGKYYKYDTSNDEFVIVSHETVTTAFNTYKDAIKLYRPLSMSMRPYRDSPNETHKNDAKSMFYSFQELFSLYHINYLCPTDPQSSQALPTPPCNYDRDIYLLGSVDDKYVLLPDGEILKHTFMFSRAEDPLKFMEDDPVDPGEYANLGHLCPPDCN